METKIKKDIILKYLPIYILEESSNLMILIAYISLPGTLTMQPGSDKRLHWLSGPLRSHVSNTLDSNEIKSLVLLIES